MDEDGEYLQRLLDGTADDQKKVAAAFVDRAFSEGVRVTASQALIFAHLYMQSNRLTLFEAIDDRMEILMGREFHGKMAAATAIKHVRRALRDLGWPVKVDAVRGLGYRLNVPKGWTL